MLLLQPLCQCSVKCAIHHEWDVCKKVPICKWCEPAIIEQLWHAISTVA